ncbi:MAG: phosphatase PAP2 family protein [Anaerolineae bacterium]|jgi:membrane-associated phospholipid phosphatase|nr:phosphatase PAP2 family protein [Anaerolineae bacterium]
MPYWMQEIGWIQAIQQIGSLFESPMKAISFLGTEGFYLILMPFLYWCVDSAIGFRVGLMLLLSNGMNTFAKVALHNPRPYWVDNRIIPYAHETSFGAPSGHAMNSASIWGLLAASIRRRWLTIVCVVTIILIGFSRVYLGVHFISDVLLGWLLGAALLVVFIRLDPVMAEMLRRRSMWQITLICIASSIAILIMIALPVWLMGDWQAPATWQELAARADANTPIHPLNLTNAFTISGIWLGTTLGYAWFKQLKIGRINKGTFGNLALRYLVGMAGVIILWYGLGQVLPRNEDVVSYGLRYVRYALIGAWIVLFAPMLFVKLRLINNQTMVKEVE